MPGVTFFCVFVRPETNRQGVVTTPLGRTRVNDIDKKETKNPWALTKHVCLNYEKNIIIDPIFWRDKYI